MDMLTAGEKAQIEKRLNDLIANRSKISERIAQARELGDLKENAEYHAAREQQGMEEAEIRRLEQRLANAGIVDGEAAKNTGVVFIGTTVRLRDLDDDDEDLYRLVGEASNDPPADCVEVTATSPMGEALMKSRIGEVVSVRAPRGTKKFEILEIL